MQGNGKVAKTYFSAENIKLKLRYKSDSVKIKTIKAYLIVQLFATLGHKCIKLQLFGKFENVCIFILQF